MNQYTYSADRIRLDIRQLRARFGDIGAEQVCDLCKLEVLQAPFYLFPCTHVFHIACVERAVADHLRLHPHRLRYFEDTDDFVSDSIEDINHETQLASSECFLCGDLMIESIGVPLICSKDLAI